jgi:hypothetical protein
MRNYKSDSVDVYISRPGSAGWRPFKPGPAAGSQATLPLSFRHIAEPIYLKYIRINNKGWSANRNSANLRTYKICCIFGPSASVAICGCAIN